jgi:uncharacterized protein (TIGR01777 family)
MRITILGASGFIGSRLAAHLRARGDDIVAAKLRDPGAAAAACAGSEVVVNLAGAPVAGAKWTAAYKEEIRRSRVDVPRALIAELGRLPEEQRPKAYVSASAVGYYGTSLTASFTEDSLPGTDFLADVCVAWEREAFRARELGMRVAVVRTGIVLGAEGGALKPLLPIFKLGGGGPIGSGKQWYSWIHIDDQVGIYTRAIDDLEGILNATAPAPVTNAAFTAALAAALHRPAFLPTPVFALRLLFGEGALMLTEGQRVLPARTESLGYVFTYPEIGAAMRDAVRNR